jgi:GH15 family glucan-1,4-alpha-glucosidase
LKQPRISDHGLIGNMRSSALVSLSGEIDFFCFPEFDSPSVFLSLLGQQPAGFFSVHPVGSNFQTKQVYVPETNILLTSFLSEHAQIELCDFMPLKENRGDHSIMRRITALYGNADISLCCSPAFDYGRSAHRWELQNEGIIFLPESNNCPPMSLRSSVELTMEGGMATALFPLKQGESACFIFGSVFKEQPAHALSATVEDQLTRTTEYWRKWAQRSMYKGRWRQEVMRSALALKLLTSEEHGSMLAAPTFGLPELPGGSFNWDYRYTWLRDSSFMVFVLTRLGYKEEGARFGHWLSDRFSRGDANRALPVMYGIDGRTELPESELNHVKGYRDSTPVRIGNGAAEQLQLDVYGELVDAIYIGTKYGNGMSHDGWKDLKAHLRWLSQNWRRADEGIWEVREGPQQFLHSRLMCWVAFDRAIRLGTARSLPGPYEWMARTRDEISEDIHTGFWNEQVGAFVQHKGSMAVDGSTLLMPLVRFISPLDPRWLSTLAEIERKLAAGPFVRRYVSTNSQEELNDHEGSFTACSFWLVEVLARSHQVDKAQILFSKLLSNANHLGLYAEEISLDGEQLGNFPQALSHLALISAAAYLDRVLGGEPPKPWS